MNATTKVLIARLVQRPLVAPQDIADVFAMQTPHAIVQDIKLGKLAASQIGNRYVISRDEALRYIASKEVMPTEGTIPQRKAQP